MPCEGCLLESNAHGSTTRARDGLDLLVWLQEAAVAPRPWQHTTVAATTRWQPTAPRGRVQRLVLRFARVRGTGKR